MLEVVYANRIKELPPYLFAVIDRLKNEVRNKGVDIIDLGIGDPDLPTPENIVEVMQKEIAVAANHRYPSYEGLLEYRKSVAGWYKRRFQVELDPICEVVSLIGSKEGIAHIPIAFVNPGDVVLVPDPGYPVYRIGTLFAGGVPYFMPLKAENGFLPDLKSIPPDVAKRAKLIFLNYPNNPTAAVAEKGFYQEVVEFALKYNIIVCHDAAYSEMAYDDYKPLSFLQIEGGKEVGIEFHSLSKTYNMTGWRIGWAAGREEIVGALGKVKTNVDSGVFQAIQYAAIEALEGDQRAVKKNVKVLEERRNLMVDGLRRLGFELEKPKASFYLWVKVPQGFSSAAFCSHMLENAGIVVTPGTGFGPSGEGYFRIALTVDKDRLIEALERFKEVGNAAK